MEPDIGQLAALVAIADLGSFEAAARALQITPSAVSQRIRALETSAGQVLVVRSSPCRPTEPGTALVRLGRQVQLLVEEAREDLGSPEVMEARIAVNADSLATWFRPVMAAAAGWKQTALRLYVEDQAWSQELLRSGEVLAAITSEPHPVQGCSSEPLGFLRYVAVATPQVAALPWDRRPIVVFNEKDTLQHDFLTGIGKEASTVRHRVPTSTDFAEAIRLGLGVAAPSPSRCGAGHRRVGPTGARSGRRTAVVAAVAARVHHPGPGECGSTRGGEDGVAFALNRLRRATRRLTPRVLGGRCSGDGAQGRVLRGRCSRGVEPGQKLLHPDHRLAVVGGLLGFA